MNPLLQKGSVISGSLNPFVCMCVCVCVSTQHGEGQRGDFGFGAAEGLSSVLCTCFSCMTCSFVMSEKQLSIFLNRTGPF